MIIYGDLRLSILWLYIRGGVTKLKTRRHVHAGHSGYRQGSTQVYDYGILHYQLPQQ